MLGAFEIVLENISSYQVEFLFFVDVVCMLYFVFFSRRFSEITKSVIALLQFARCHHLVYVKSIIAIFT